VVACVVVVAVEVMVVEGPRIAVGVAATVVVLGSKSRHSELQSEQL
jgi:hypothetical protein